MTKLQKHNKRNKPPEWINFTEIIDHLKRSGYSQFEIDEILEDMIRDLHDHIIFSKTRPDQ